MPSQILASVERRDLSDVRELRAAPKGFTREQWQEFEREGLLVIPDALSQGEIKRYLEAAHQCIRAHPDYSPTRTWKIHNLVNAHPDFADLIDHDRHIGYAYDIYGDQLRLVQADMFIRPRQGVINHWHIDGPRALPYRAFSPVLPLKLRIGYWLTDVPHTGMGNLVYLPGSHHPSFNSELTGIIDLPEQKTLCCRAGTITIAHASMWHRVMANDSDVTRVNLFLSYTPSWVTGYYSYSDEWLEGLSREQRIILRAYKDKECFTRPPEEDLPLFNEAALVGTDSNEEAHKVRRLTRYERYLKN